MSANTKKLDHNQVWRHLHCPNLLLQISVLSNYMVDIYNSTAQFPWHASNLFLGLHVLPFGMPTYTYTFLLNLSAENIYFCQIRLIYIFIYIHFTLE